MHFDGTPRGSFAGAKCLDAVLADQIEQFKAVGKTHVLQYNRRSGQILYVGGP